MMNSRNNNSNPLLFPASNDSPFDNLPGSALLIPPSSSDLQDAGEEGSFLGQPQMPNPNVKESVNFGSQSSAPGGIVPGGPPAAFNVLPSSGVAPNVTTFTPSLPTVPSVIPPYQTPISGGIPGYLPPCSTVLGSPSPQGGFSNTVGTATPLPSSSIMGSKLSSRNGNSSVSPSSPPSFLQGSSIPFSKPAEVSVFAPSNTEGHSALGTPLPPSREGSPYSPTRNNMIPVSFENMASNPPGQDGVYHPVIHHWFYASGQPRVWKPFSFKDSFNLEEAFQQGNPDVIATEGGRYDVNISERLRKPVYWEEAPSPVRRCSWFRKSPLEAQPVPYEEEIAEKLEAEYRDAMMTGQWHRQVNLEGGDRIMIHSTRTMIHFVGLDGDFSTVNGAQSPLTAKRGTEDFEIADGEADQVDHILFLVHGIGSVCDLRFRAVEECVDDFRKLGHQLLSTHFKQSVDMGLVGRVEILPVSWHKALHGDATGIDKRLKPITLRSIPKLREFTNDTILDVLLFTSPMYCQHIMDTVASELNRLYDLFCQRNPTFSGLVSLGGHSLGSVILFDLLMHQLDDSQGKEEEESPIIKEELSAFLDRKKESVSSPINYMMGGPGTGQPSLIYPKLAFKPEAFFLMGSPYAMFVTVRGIDTIGVDYELPTCKRVFNIFHPFDPVAYRLETLINPDLINWRPVLIPHHKGRKRMHLELKETIERVGTEFKQKIVDSIQGTWNRLYQLYSGTAAKSIEHEVDKALADRLYLEEEDNQAPNTVEQEAPVGRLNGGRRIDYVLQEKPYESFNEYIFALQAHVTYWESEDTMLLILKELYGPQGISCDAEHLSQHAQTSMQLPSDGDSALGSGTASPTSPPVFDVASGVLQTPDASNSSVLPSPSPVPLFTTAPTSPTNTASFPSNPSYMSNTAAYSSTSVLSGRPILDINSQPKGMDPTSMPGENKPVGPPPKLPSGTFTRSTPFRR